VNLELELGRLVDRAAIAAGVQLTLRELPGGGGGGAPRSLFLVWGGWGGWSSRGASKWVCLWGRAAGWGECGVRAGRSSCVCMYV